MTKRKPVIRRLLLRQIRLDFQPTENLIDEVVAEYAHKMRRRVRIDPVQVCHDGKDYWLKDGFHRFRAALALGRKTIATQIIPGTLDEMEAEWQQCLTALRADLAKS
jgi:ParB-like chromosome segregation protein Spo0J